MKRLSVTTTCSHAFSKQFYLEELINSVEDIAHEIVLVNGDAFGKFETYDLTDRLIPKCPLRIMQNPWNEDFGKNMYALQKNIGIANCTGDYILRLDADEVIHEEDHEKILQAMELGHRAYTFQTIHFWRDYKHVIRGSNSSDPGNDWYSRKVYLFRNFLGFNDGHDRHGGSTPDDLITRDWEPVLEFAKNTSIRIFHYGHTDRNGTYLNKKNQIERAYHPGRDNLDRWEWDMSNTVPFTGAHPTAMKERIKAEVI